MKIFTISSKGQFTLPKAVREQLGVKPGDKVRIDVGSEEGTFLIRPLRHRRRARKEVSRL